MTFNIRKKKFNDVDVTQDSICLVYISSYYRQRHGNLVNNYMFLSIKKKNILKSYIFKVTFQVSAGWFYSKSQICHDWG